MLILKNLVNPVYVYFMVIIAAQISIPSQKFCNRMFSFSAC